jgi:hypothetical protein
VQFPSRLYAYVMLALALAGGFIVVATFAFGKSTANEIARLLRLGGLVQRPRRQRLAAPGNHRTAPRAMTRSINNNTRR